MGQDSHPSSIDAKFLKRVPHRPLRTPTASGVVIGSGDRALESKARDNRPSRTVLLIPRVTALQNRMRLTQSPRRANPNPSAVHFATVATVVASTPQNLLASPFDSPHPSGDAPHYLPKDAPSSCTRARSASSLAGTGRFIKLQKALIR